MGRPLNKKFFGDGSGLLAVECYTERAGASTAGYIVRQRSNLIYEVADETATASTALVVDSLYEIVTVSGADYTTVGAANNSIGTRFTATGTSAGGTGTATEVVFGKLQAAAVTAAGELRLPVTPENATATVQATVTFTDTAGAIDDPITSFTGGYGYWADGTGVVVAGGGGDGTVDYTVANGVIVTMVYAAGGSGYTGGTQNIADAPAANPPEQYARILNARQVKCFPQEGGNTFAWPTTAPLGGDRSGFTEADPDTQA